LENKGTYRIGYAQVPLISITEDVTEFELKNETDYVDLKSIVPSVSLRVVPPVDPTIPIPKRIGYVRIVTWQGKSLDTNYCVFVRTFINTIGSASYRSSLILNPHNPIFDHLSEIDIYSLQGDIIIALWENHAMRQDRILGQVIIPITWVLQCMNVTNLSNVATLSGWFEVFPYNKPSKYNRGGQYR
jgi:hypothetical protein